ncbi:MAG: PilZ domain-containing protein [Candidatus Eiseniibacteriota bacterium]|jgi:c-di-GMP-binding flagellar brake protein YcgR
MSTGKERRQSRRVTTDLELTVAGLDQQSVAARTVNLSAGGAYLVVERPLAPLAKLELTIELPPLADAEERDQAAGRPTRFPVEAVVVHSEPVPDSPGAHRVGVAFMSMSPAARRHLEDYIDWRLTRSLLESAERTPAE